MHGYNIQDVNKKIRAVEEFMFREDGRDNLEDENVWEANGGIFDTLPYNSGIQYDITPHIATTDQEYGMYVDGSFSVFDNENEQGQPVSVQDNYTPTGTSSAVDMCPTPQSDIISTEKKRPEFPETGIGLYATVTLPIFSGTVSTYRSNSQRKNRYMDLDVLNDSSWPEGMMLPTYNPRDIGGELVIDRLMIGHSMTPYVEYLYIRVLRRILIKLRGFYIFPRIYNMAAMVIHEIQKWQSMEGDVDTAERFTEFHNQMWHLLKKTANGPLHRLSKRAVDRCIDQVALVVRELLIAADLDTLRDRKEETSRAPTQIRLTLDRPQRGVLWCASQSRWTVHKNLDSVTLKWHYPTILYNHAGDGFKEAYNEAIKGKKMGILPNGDHFSRLLDNDYADSFNKEQAAAVCQCMNELTLTDVCENPLLGSLEDNYNYQW